MPIGAQPPGRRGTVGEPYSPLNLRLVLAVFGFALCTGLALLLWRWDRPVPAWILAAWAAVAVIDMVVVQLRRRARKRDEGLAAAIAENPRVAIAYFSPDGPGARFLSIEGRARVAPEANDEVFAGMVELEQQFDADRNGVAVLIEVDSVSGAGADGFFQQTRA